MGLEPVQTGFLQLKKVVSTLPAFEVSIGYFVDKELLEAFLGRNNYHRRGRFLLGVRHYSQGAETAGSAAVYQLECMQPGFKQIPRGERQLIQAKLVIFPG